MERTQRVNIVMLWLAACVVAISCFTHLYRIGHTYIFQNDEGRDALITYRMIDQHKPVLLGPETSVGNMYLGPFYYYMLVPALLASGLNPVGPAILVALFGIATTWLLIKVGEKYFDRRVGLLAGLIYALSPIMVHYSRNSWNPNVVPFFALILFILHKKEKLWADLVSGAIIGILFQLHYVALVLPLLLFLSRSWIYAKKRDHIQLLRYCIVLLIGFVITTFPFWLFEMRHQWVNTRAFFTYLEAKSIAGDGGGPNYAVRLVHNTQMVVNDIVGSNPVSRAPLNPLGAVLAFFVLCSLLMSQRSRYIGYILFGSVFITSILKENIYVHYVAFLFPFICLGVSCVAFSKNWTKYLAVILLLVLGTRAVPALAYNIGVVESSQPVRAQLVADYIAREANGRPYNVVNSQGSYTTTIQYYLAKEKNRPRNDLQDLVYDICVGGPCPADDETTVLLFLTGPAHPSLADYLGHPEMNEFSGKRHFVKNEWVAYDIWVATIVLDH